MRKILVLIAVPFLLLLFFVGNISAREQRTTKVITLPSNEVITKDFYVTGGDVVEISGTVNGDVIVGAGQLTIDGTVNGDVLVAGGTVDISGEVRDDARIAGGQIDISGSVGRNLLIGGGDINLTSDSVVVGGVVIGGGNVKLAGEIGGDVLIAAGNVTLSNVISGDVEIYTGALRITSNAEIEGDLVYTSEEEASVDKNATISGKMLRKTPPVAVTDKDIESIREGLSDIFKIGLWAKLISFASALIIGLILIKLFPSYIELTTKVLKDSPWRTLLYGFLFLLITPFLVIILLMTVVGIPMAFFAVFAYISYIYLAKIFVGYWLGKKIPIGDKKNLYGSFAVGLAAYYLVTLIPYVGGFLAFFALLFGIGAGLISCVDYYRKKLAKSA